MSSPGKCGRAGPERHKVSVLVLNQGGGWVTEVAIRCNGQLKTYRRNEQTIHPTQDEARLAGYQWAEDYLRAQACPATLPLEEISPSEEPTCRP
jgi:hypothetical protein